MIRSRLASVLALAGLLLLALTPACTRNPAPRAGSPPPPEASLLGAFPMEIPFGLVIDGLDVGGLSAIVPRGDGSYLALVDNQGVTDARLFVLNFLVNERGVSPRPGQTARQVPRGVVRLSDFNGLELDAEGLARLPSGNLLVSSETEPAIREFSPGGALVRALPVPRVFRAVSREGEGRGVRHNEGFESLALGADGRTLWTANERPLRQDAPGGDLARPAPVRLLRFGVSEDRYLPGPQYVYEVEPVERTSTGFSTRGLVDLLALPEGDLLALEREYVEGSGMEVQLFRVSLAGATDVSGFAALAGESYTPVRKTLLFDFATTGFFPDNFEGMAFGPVLPDGSRTVLLVSDNNFSPLQATQIVALRLGS
jgi:hypothetical protein